MNARLNDKIREEPLQLMMDNQEVIQLAYAHMEHITPLMESRQDLTVDAACCYTAAFYTIKRQLESVDGDYLAAHDRINRFYRGYIENQNERLDWFPSEDHPTDTPEPTIDSVFEPAKSQNEIIEHWQRIRELAAEAIATEARELADTFRKQRTGDCDGGGAWHGSDVDHYLAHHGTRELRERIETELERLETARNRLEECAAIMSPNLAGPLEETFPF